MGLDRGRSAAALFVIATLLAAPGFAQPGRQVTRAPNELLAGVIAAPESANPAVREDIAQVLAYPETYPPDDLATFLNGLEDLAVGGPGHRVRISAVIDVYTVGRRGRKYPVPGTVNRLQRIYDRSEDGSVRDAILFVLPSVAERGQAVRFLEALAVKGSEHRGYPWSVRNSIGGLARMGAEGAVALRRLHESGAVEDPEARGYLSEMAARDFRIQ